MNETWANTALKESRQRSSGDQRERERERAPVSIGFHLELGGRYSCKLWKQLATRPGNIRPANESNIAFDTLSSRVMIFGQGLVRPGRFAGRVRPDACRARTRGTTGVFVWAGNCGQYVAFDAFFIVISFWNWSRIHGFFFRKSCNERNFWRKWWNYYIHF